MIESLKHFLAALAAGLGFLKKKQELENSPQQQANAAAKTDRDIKEDATRAVATNDLDEIRKQAAE